MASKGKKSGTSVGGSLSIQGMSKKTLQTRLSSFNVKDVPKTNNAGTQPQIGLEVKATKSTYVSEKKGKMVKSKPVPTVNIGDTASKKAKPQYDKAATQKFDDMLDGDMTDLPPLPKTMVKIFLSSTFSDMRAERNILARQAYPQLSEFCAECGLDFQVVDMRWGVTEDSQNDHSVEKLCLLEVNNCQKASIGPNFVVLSGDRYGFRPLPTEIQLEEFKTLKNEAVRLEMPNVELLDQWYKLDTNCIPNMYLLQPIRSKFTFFADYSPGCDEPRKKDTAEWWKTFEALQNLLRACADEAFKRKNITREQRHEYFLSVTECEIQEGILRAKDVNSHCLVYKRELSDLDGEALTQENASRFIDIIKTDKGLQKDKEISSLKESLITKTIPGSLSKARMRFYRTPWRSGGVDPDTHPEHQQYLSQFCTNFVEDCKQMVSVALAERKNLIMMSNYYSDYQDTIHHLRFCQSKCDSFCGQEKVIEAARSYVLDESNRTPLVIHGRSGAGKTSITAMIMKSISTWLKGAEHIKLIRFLGTSPQSNNIYDVLFSVVGQLSDDLDLIMPPMSYKTMKSLQEYLPRYLRQVATTAKMPIIIILDSIDQLDPVNGAYMMEWLPALLPANVKWILSTITEHEGILNNMRKRLPDEKCYVEVPILPESTGKLIVETYLKNSKRTITEDQMKLLLKVFKQSPSPLFLKLLIDEAHKWKSYTPLSEIRLASSVKEAINQLFSNLEIKFGSLLISHALGYITIGITGLTEFEIEDVLSCDDEVLNEVYRFHDPPIPGIVRIPPVLWARIREDIKEYLVERISFNKTTLSWYHRQFIETARERYTSNSKDTILHKNLTNIYLQDNGVMRTITLTHRKNLTIQDANREIRPLPFIPQNRRKLVCLPFHAVKAIDVLGKDFVKSKVLCNFKFLTTKITAFSVAAVVNILKDYNMKNQDPEVTLLLDFLTVTQNDLSQPTRLAVCLLSSLAPAEHHNNLKILQKDAFDYLQDQKRPLLIPRFPCLAPRKNLSSALNTTIQGIEKILASSSDSVLLKTRKTGGNSEEAKSEYAVFEAATQDLQQIDLPDLAKTTDVFIIDSDYIYFTSTTSFIKYSYKRKKTDMVKFSQLISKWEEGMVVTDFKLSQDDTTAALALKGAVVLVDLATMKGKHKMITKVKCAEIDSLMLLPLDYEDIKIVALGTVVNSTSADKPQGPDNQSFVCMFSGDKDTPEVFQHTDVQYRKDMIVLAGQADRRLAAVVNGNKSNQNLSVESQKPQEMNCPAKLHIFGLTPLQSPTVFELPSTLSKLEGDPTQPHVVALTVTGVFYVVNVDSASIVLEVKLNHDICTFAVTWENQISLLASTCGAVTLYNIGSNLNLGAFPASPIKIRDVRLCNQQFVTLDTGFELRSWTVQALISEAKNRNKQEVNQTSTEDGLIDQAAVSCIGLPADGHEIYTCTQDGFLKIWDLDSFKLLRQYTIDISATQLIVLNDSSTALYDSTSQQVLVIDPESGTYPMLKSAFPPNIIAMTANAEKDMLYIVHMAKQDHLHIDVISIQHKKTAKTIALQKPLPHTSIDICLSQKERYLVLKTGVSDKEYEAIQTMTKKSGSFMEQPHHWKFTAVDLSQGNGALIPCFRQLSKIPTLGTLVAPYTGNTMLITCRRMVVFWDIPTGKCDQKTCKPEKHIAYFYRPGWLGQQCKGTTNAMVMSPSQKYLALGSEDGYMFIYDAETGHAKGKTKPATKHNSEVHMIVFSSDSEWVASTCQSSILKLWDNAGKEQFSFRLDSKVQSMMFTPDSSHLVLYTGTHTTRMLVFTVHKKT